MASCVSNNYTKKLKFYWYLVCLETIVLAVDFCFPTDVFYLFFIFSQGISMVCRPIATKFCIMVESRLNFYNAGPKKFRSQMQNLARFWTTSNFDGKSLYNG